MDTLSMPPVMKASAVFVLLSVALTLQAQIVRNQTPGYQREYCCQDNDNPTQIFIMRSGERFTFNVYRVRAEYDLGITYQTQLERIEASLDRLPSSHLRVLQTLKIVIGRPCVGGGSNPCRNESGGFTANSCLMVSHECFRPISNNQTFECSGRQYENNRGSWNEEHQVLGTLLHEAGHFIDYYYRIIRNLSSVQRRDCNTCVRDPECYKGNRSLGGNEIIAEAYMMYFLRTRYWEVLNCADEYAPCPGAGTAPRTGRHPSPSGRLFTAVRIAYLTNSPAWEDWD